MTILFHANTLASFFGAGDASAATWRAWADRLPSNEAWSVLGVIRQIAPDSASLPETDPNRAVTASLALLEAEFSDWLQRPSDVLECFLATRAYVQTNSLRESWHWSSLHRTAWTALHMTPAPRDAPSGFRVLPLVEKSADTLLSRLEIAIPALLMTVSLDMAAARRISRSVRCLSERIGFGVDSLLGSSYRDLCEMERVVATAESGSMAWKTIAIARVDEFQRGLPADLADRVDGWIDQLRKAVDSYCPAPPVPTAEPPYSDESSIEFRLGHFLNNWD